MERQPKLIQDEASTPVKRSGFELTASDLAEFREAVTRVYELMRDGEWHIASAIEEAAGTPGRPAREGLRRMRELRQLLAARGYCIECRRGVGQDHLSRNSAYRIRDNSKGERDEQRETTGGTS